MKAGHVTVYYPNGRLEIATYADGSQEFRVYIGIVAHERKEVNSYREALIALDVTDEAISIE